MTLHLTEIERVRPARRPSWDRIAAARQKQQTHDSLRLIVEAQAAREALFWSQWEEDFLREVPR